MNQKKHDSQGTDYPTQPEPDDYIGGYYPDCNEELEDRNAEMALMSCIRAVNIKEPPPWFHEVPDPWEDPQPLNTDLLKGIEAVKDTPDMATQSQGSRAIITPPPKPLPKVTPKAPTRTTLSNYRNQPQKMATPPKKTQEPWMPVNPTIGKFSIKPAKQVVAKKVE